MSAVAGNPSYLITFGVTGAGEDLTHLSSFSRFAEVTKHSGRVLETLTYLSLKTELCLKNSLYLRNFSSNAQTQIF